MKLTIRMSYFVIPTIVFGIAAVGRFFTSYGMIWYEDIARALFIPPFWFFNLIWDVVDVITTTTVVIIWDQLERGIRFWLLIFLFLINAFLNVYWPYLLFYQRQIGAALVNAILLELTVLVLIFLIWPASHKITYLLVPYAACAMMMIALNLIIWIVV